MTGSGLIKSIFMMLNTSESRGRKDEEGKVERLGRAGVVCGPSSTSFYLGLQQSDARGRIVCILGNSN